MTDRLGDLLARRLSLSPTTKGSSTPSIRDAMSNLAAPRLSPVPQATPQRFDPAALGRAAVSELARQAIPDPPKLSIVPQTQSLGPMRQPTASRTRQQEQEPWGVFEAPSGHIAMPVSWGEANPDFRMMGDPITDPQQIERAKQSDYAYENLPEERKAEVRMPGKVDRMDPASMAAGIARLTLDAKRMEEQANRSGTMGQDGPTQVRRPARQRDPEAQEPTSDFALVTNTQTNTTELITKDALRDAPDGLFVVITPDVTAKEAQQISDLGLVGGVQTQDTIRGPEDMAGAMPDQLAERGGISLRPSDVDILPDLSGVVDTVQDTASSVVDTVQDAASDLMEDPAGTLQSAREGVQRLDEEAEAFVRRELLEAQDAFFVEFRKEMADLWNALPGTEKIDEPGLPAAIEAITTTAGEVWNAEAPGTDISLDSIWNGEIPGTDTTIGEIASSILDQNVIHLNDGEGISLREISSAFFEYVNTAGDDSMIALVDRKLGEITGQPVDSGSRGGDAIRRVPVIGDLLGGAYEALFDNPLTNLAADELLGYPMVDWMESNPDLVTGIAADGYDIDGDGTNDIFGSDAVLTYWLNDVASAREAIQVLTLMDPLTLVAGTGVVGRWIVRGGKIIRVADNATPLARVVGRGMEVGGEVIYRTSRAAEIVGDLGAEYALRGVAAMARKTGLTRPISKSRVEANLAKVDKTGGEVLERERRQERVIATDAEGRGHAISVDPPTDKPIVDAPQVPGSVAPDVARQTTDPETGARIVADEVDTNLENTRILEREDGTAIVEREAADGTPVQTETATVQDAWEIVQSDLAAAGPDGIPVRWRQRTPQEGRIPRAIDTLPRAIYNDLAARMGPEWAESVDIMREVGSGPSLPPHAIESSRIARRTINTLEDIRQDTGAQFETPHWELNGGSFNTPMYEATDQVIRLDWNDTSAQRDLLAGRAALRRPDGDIINPRFPVASPRPLGRSNRGATAANNYVNMLYEHAKWHPESFGSRSFREAWQAAVTLDAQLRARNLRAVPGGHDPGPLSEMTGTGNRTYTPDESVVRASADTITNAPGEAVDTPAEDGRPDIMDRYEMVPEDDGRTVVYLTDAPDSPVVYLEPVKYSEVPTRWRDFFPMAPKRGWHNALLEWVGENGQLEKADLYAPSDRQALGLAAEEARERGLLPDDPPQRGGDTPTMRAAGEGADAFEYQDTSPIGKTTPVRKAQLPTEGQTKEINGIPVTNADAQGKDVWIWHTNAGEFAITFDRGRWSPIDPVAAAEGRIVGLPTNQKWRLADLERQMQVRHVTAPEPTVPDVAQEQAVPDEVVPEEAVTEPEPEPVDTTAQQASAQDPSTMSDEALAAAIRDGGETDVSAFWDEMNRRHGDSWPEQQAAVERAVLGSEDHPLASKHQPDMSTLEPVDPATVETRPDATGTVDVPIRQAADPDPEVTLEVPDPLPHRDILENPPDTKPGGLGIIEDPKANARGMIDRHFGRPGRLGIAVDSQGNKFWLRRPISDEEIDILTQHQFTDGKYGENGLTFLDRVAYRVKKNGDMDGWKAHEEVYEKIAIEQTWKEYVDLLHEVYPAGVLPQRVSRGIAKLPRPIRKALEAVAWVLRAPVKASDGYMDYMRTRALISHTRAISYPALQLFGNTWNLGMAGHPSMMVRYWNPREYLRARKVLMESQTGNGPRWNTARGKVLRDPAISANQKMHAAMGTRQGKFITETHHTQLGKLDEDLPITKALSLVLPKRTARGIGKLTGSRKHMLNATAFDTAMREVAELELYRSELKLAVPDFRNQTINKLMDWGVDRADATRLWGEFWDAQPTFTFHMDDLIDFFEPHVGKGRAIRLGRDWQETVAAMDKRIEPQARRITYAGDETRADLVMRRLFFFHHFASRQSWFYLSQMAKHPYLINMYFNAMDELEKASEGWPDYLQNWVKLMVTPFGFQLFMNPVALGRSFITFIGNNNTFEDPDNTRLGVILKEIEQIIGINPLAKEILNTAGAFGDDFAPDWFGMWQEVHILNTAINYARAYGLFGDDPRPDHTIPYTQWMLDLRETVSGLNPWRDEAVPARDAEAQEIDREIQLLIVDELEKAGAFPKGSTQAEREAIVAAVLLDPDNPIHIAAIKRWVNGEAVLIGARFIGGMFQPRMRPVNSEGEDLYHSLSRDMKSIVNTTDPRALQLRQQEEGWFELGTQKQQETEDLWAFVAFDFVNVAITVNGTRYSPNEINAMDREQRIALANALLEDYGLLEDYYALQDEQAKYLAQPENKEYAQYKTWSGAVRDYPGGIDAYWQAEIEAGNPNAERYYNAIMSESMLPQQREMALTNMNAYFAVGGIQASVWDPAVKSTGPGGTVVDVANVANQPAQPTPYEEPSAEFKDEVRQAPVYLAELEQWDEAVTAKQAEMGYDPNVPFNELEPEVRVEIEDALKEDGISEPEAPYGTKVYLEWAEQQPRGADTSIEAFFIANDREWQSKAGERLDEAIRMPKAIPGPDAQGNVAPAPQSGDLWMNILRLLDEHDHRRYPDTSSSSSGGSSGSGDEDYWLFQYLR